MWITVTRIGKRKYWSCEREGKTRGRKNPTQGHLGINYSRFRVEEKQRDKKPRNVELEPSHYTNVRAGYSLSDSNDKQWQWASGGKFMNEVFVQSWARSYLDLSLIVPEAPMQGTLIRTALYIIGPQLPLALQVARKSKEINRPLHI